MKRGTSRAAFSSPDAGLDKFSAAEAMLFGASAKPADAEPQQQARSAVPAPPRRILESLTEAPAVFAEIEDEDEPVERPRRGRKPGSKNKPKVVAEPVNAAPPVLSAAAQAFMKAPSAKAEPGVAAAPRPVAAPAEPIVVPPEPIVLREPRPAEGGEGRRGRLRERSSIIQRYVLGTVPQPGQTGSLRARKLARAAAVR